MHETPVGGHAGAKAAMKAGNASEAQATASNSLPTAGKIEHSQGLLHSSTKTATAVRNQNGLLNGPPAAAYSTVNGILVAKEEIFHKNKTFNYPKESSTSRGDHFMQINGVGGDSRRQRSSKAPPMSVVEAQKQAVQGSTEGALLGKGSHGGHFTPQLMMSSQSES